LRGLCNDSAWVALEHERVRQGNETIGYVAGTPVGDASLLEAFADPDRVVGFNVSEREERVGDHDRARTGIDLYRE